ncbi:MAG: beta-propeller fold lactonase family protein [Acidobacteriota bacterium]|nr:beta-propeller fold lactonase family protein [Acidobacteriota bacterium]
MPSADARLNPACRAAAEPSRLATVTRCRRTLFAATSAALLALTAGCHRNRFPDVPAGYREFAYVTNGTSNTVSVLDLVYLRADRTLAVGNSPTGIAANPVRDEVYAVNTGSGTVSVIDTDRNQVVATIPVHRQPYFIAVEPTGHRAYVANSGSNNVSVLDLDKRREIAVAGTGEQPGLAVLAPDMRSLVVTNRGSGSVSIFAVAAPDAPGPVLALRSVYSGCPGATHAVILKDSSKAFVACSGGHQVMAISLAAAPGSWALRQDATQANDHLLALLDVGQTPIHLALKPDSGEIFVSNFGSDSVSELSTWTNEVSSTYTIASKPVQGIVAEDNSSLYLSNFGADTLGLWSIDDGRLVASLHTGSAPDALAFSADQHLLLVADAHSGDVSVIRTQGNPGPALFTLLPAGGSPNAIAVKAMSGR